MKMQFNDGQMQFNDGGKIIVPSHYQQAILDDVLKHNMVVQAVAGSGKSKTLEMMIAVIRHRNARLRATLLAFNKSIATELKDRNLPASTFNSMGHGLCMYHFKSTLNTDKPYDIMKKVLSREDMKKYGSQVLNLVSKAYTIGLVPDLPMLRNAGLKAVTPEHPKIWDDLLDQYSIDFDDESYIDDAINAAREVYGRCLLDTKQITFDDQIALPVLYDVGAKKSDALLVDEAQDTNALQIAFIKKITGPRSFLVAVGDRNQSLYGFRGAASDAMDQIKSAFRCREYPLSITYRCPQAVVREAQTIVPDIEAAPDAPEGTVETLNSHGSDNYEPGDLIVCRNNAPLISMAYRLIASRKPCIVIGRDIAQNLVSKIKKIKDAYDRQKRDEDEIEYLIQALTAKKDQDIEKTKAQDKESKVESILDQYETMMVIVESSDSLSMDGVMREIETLFGGDKTRGKVRLSTVHRAKGLEANRVFWLDSYLCPSRRARTPEEIHGENCIMYVAITRAKQALYYVSSDNWNG